MVNQIEIYKSSDNRVELRVQFDKDTVWLNRQQISFLFDRDVKTIGKHINNIFSEGELDRGPVVANFATTAADGKTYQVDHYNLDVIISVGYRVKSQRGTQFRQWATQRLKDYLVTGYAINEKRLEQTRKEVKYLKTGISILSRAIEEKLENADAEMLQIFSGGLSLLDDYDHENLDKKGLTVVEAVYPDIAEYLKLISMMRSEFESEVFAKPKDNNFESSINQIRQSIGGKDLYPSLEEKAAMLLYLIVKNHSFVDGNKRIAAACFLFFLRRNNFLLDENRTPVISNEALAAMTLFIAVSKPEEMETVKNVVVSVLNRSG